jgi:hypothetical protein
MSSTVVLDEDKTISRVPLSLTDSQITAILDAAQPLPPDLRSPFLAACARALRGVTIGDGRPCAPHLLGSGGNRSGASAV